MYKCKQCQKELEINDVSITPFSYPSEIKFCSIDCWIKYEESGTVIRNLIR